MGYIYLITNTVNGKKYVGQSQQSDIETRWKQHRKCESRSIGRYLINAYKKHGIDNFKFQIICICFDDACNTLEEQYIQKYNCLVPNGYNLKAGGKNSKHHPDTIKKMSEALKGRKLKPITEETRNKMSIVKKAEKNPNYRKKMSEEQKKKISDAHKNIQKNGHKNISEEKRLSQLEGLKKGREICKKRVGKYDLEGNLLTTYSSTVEAGKKENIHYTVIGKVCLQKPSYKTAGGFVWKYLTNPKE